MTDAPRSRAARAFGVLLMVAGVLIGISASLCSLAIGTFMVMDWPTTSQEWNDMISEHVPNLLICGLMPLSIGAGLFFAGRALKATQ